MPTALLIDDDTLAEVLELTPAQFATLPDFLLVFAREFLTAPACDGCGLPQLA